MKYVVVTGGARGIGSALVEIFHKNKYSVFYSYKSAPGLSGERLFPFKADCSTESGVLEFFSFIKEYTANIDCLINNVGVARFSLLATLTTSDFDELFNVNFKSAWLCYKYFHNMLMSDSSIINLLSIASIKIKKGNGLYAASKSALSELSKFMRLELKTRGIRIYDLIPGFVLTEALSSPFYSEIREKNLIEIPLKRFGEPKEIAEVAFYLNQKGFGLEESKFVITGGQHLSTNLRSIYEF